MEQELIRIFRSTSKSQRRRGKAWYSLAEAACERMSREYGVSKVRVACIMGITSPRTQLVNNLRRTENVLQGKPVGGFSYMDEQVRAPIARINGPKVVPFAKAIMGKDVLVLDTWALHAVGLPDRPSAAQRAEAVAAYTSAAKRCRQSLRDFQAIIWIAVREQAVRSNGVAYRNADIHELLEASNA
jgi:hypothetical protein